MIPCTNPKLQEQQCSCIWVIRFLQVDSDTVDCCSQGMLNHFSVIDSHALVNDCWIIKMRVTGSNTLKGVVHLGELQCPINNSIRSSCEGTLYFLLQNFVCNESKSNISLTNCGRGLTTCTMHKMRCRLQALTYAM